MRNRIRKILYEAIAFEDRPNINDAFWKWFGDSKIVDSKGDPLVMYHGSKRPDRIGTTFKKSRATSGPMSFFTNDPSVASSYSESKNDTSIEMEGDYTKLFMYYPEGKKRGIYIGDVWSYLSPSQKEIVRNKLPYIHQDEDSEELYIDTEEMSFNQSVWEGKIQEKRGDIVGAAIYMWLESGTLYNDEKLFTEILAMGGLKNVKMIEQNQENPGVVPVYLSIQNPLVTSDIPQDVIDAVVRASKRQRLNGDGYGSPDPWNKNYQDPQRWASLLVDKSDLIWTSIPDWVTKVLIGLGYDGIIDSGGKLGGDSHNVVIPFHPEQIKSVFNNGTWDKNKRNISQ